MAGLQLRCFGGVLVSLPLTARTRSPPRSRWTRRCTSSGDGRGEIIFGAGLMPNTAEAGAPQPDGYVYVYGHQNAPSTRSLVAR
jgi:hypothetical protein